MFFRSRKMGQSKNSIHKVALKLVYEDSHDLTFPKIADQRQISLYVSKIFLLLTTEVFKSKTVISPELMNDIFHILH